MQVPEEELDDDAGGTGIVAPVKTVRYDRFQQVVQARNELRTKASQLETQVQQLTEKSATADTLARQLETLKTDFASKTAAWDEERGLLRAGLTDPDDVDLAKLFHGKVPAAERKPLGDWWAGLKADPTKAPRQLQPLLGSVEKPPEKKTETTPQGGQEPPKGNASTTTGSKAGGQAAGGDPVSAEKIVEIRERCRKSGDWTEWKTIRGQLG